LGKFLDWLFLSDYQGEQKARSAEPEGAKALTMSAPLLSTISNYGWPWSSYSALYRTQPAVRTVVDFMARNVAQLNMKVYERRGNDRPEIDNHPLAKLLRQPNHLTTRYRHTFATVADIGIYDRAYWRKVRVNGKLKAVWRIPPPSIWSETDPETGHVMYRLASGEVLQRGIDLVVFPGYNPDGGDEGVSPLETLRRILTEESASVMNREAYWKNAARQSGWIERPLDAPEWSEEARKRFRTDMESTMAGASNAGRIGVLEEGMTWNGTAFSPRESEYTESRKLTYEEVTRVYGIPFALIGALSESKSNVESFHRQLYQDVLGPKLRFLQDEIELQLLPEFEKTEERRNRIYVEYNLAEKLKGNFDESAKTLVTSVGVPYMTPNEARARLNLPSIDDEAFDQPVKPLNVMYGGQPAVTVPTEDPGTPQMASYERAVRDIVEALKHLPGQHDQETHGNDTSDGIDIPAVTWEITRSGFVDGEAGPYFLSAIEHGETVDQASAYVTGSISIAVGEPDETGYLRKRSVARVKLFQPGTYTMGDRDRAKRLMQGLLRAVAEDRAPLDATVLWTEEAPNEPIRIEDSGKAEESRRAAQARTYEKALRRYFEYQEREVLSELGAYRSNGKSLISAVFDDERWNRHLTTDLFTMAGHLQDDAVKMAEQINGETRTRLGKALPGKADVRAVFVEAKDDRATQIAGMLAQEIADKGVVDDS